MTTKSPLCVLFALMATTAIACGPPKKLDRDTALSLLRARAVELLSDDKWAIYTKFAAIQGQERWDCELAVRLAFLDRLVEQGIMTKETTPLRPSWGQAGIEYTFTIKDPTFAREITRNLATVTTAFTMGTQSLKEVTGIVQEEGSVHAVVEASVATEPTPLLKVLADVEAEQGGRRRCRSSYHFRSKQSRKFSLVRYDDGWRIEDTQE